MASPECLSVGQEPIPPAVYALDFSAWKRPLVRQCFPHSQVNFVSRLEEVPPDACLAVWGTRVPDKDVPTGIRITRLEDGFLRSVGLGADLIRPMSWVADRCGIYYDATRPSDLEILLAKGEFTTELLARAKALRERVVAARLTKYNVGQAQWQRPSAGQRLILVPGQVESDASLAFGAPGIRRNMDLLRAVREGNPEAYVIYKPHPDVVARLRAAGEGEKSALEWCDEVVLDVPMDSLLEAVDEVHLMTSLTGFEALLRGKRVTCYGQPFYSGWGLTTDVISHPRRVRKLALDELVAGTLIQYPLYFDRDGRGLITPEAALDQLLAWRERSGRGTPWWRSLSRMALRIIVGVR